MPTNRHTLRSCCFLPVLIAVITLVPSLGHAVSMDVQAGFGGSTKSTAWTPIAVKLSNASDEGIEGTLSVAKSDLSRGKPTSLSASVNLPPRSEKLYHIYARLPSYDSDVTVVLSRGSGTAALNKLKVNPVATEDTLVVSVGDRTSRLNFLAGETLTRNIRLAQHPQGATPSNIAIGSVEPSALPDRPLAYDGVDVLVISDLSPASASPKALKALSMWVASGGVLVVSAGPNYQNYRYNFYDELLPVKITGAADLGGLECLSGLGRTQFPAGAVAVARSTVKPGIGTSLVTESGIPIVATREYGAGRVIFLAFDYKSSPFREWNGQTDFWKCMIVSATVNHLVIPTTAYLERNPSYGTYLPGEIEDSMAAVVAPNPSISTPSFNTIGLFLLAYLIALVPVNYFVLKRKGRLELAWVTTPLIVVVFTIGAYAIGYTMKGSQLHLSEAMLIEGASDCRYARTLTNASLFSPARRSYDVEVSDAYGLAEVLVMEEGKPTPDVYVGEKSLISGLNMAMWSSETFESMGGTDLGGAIASSLELDGKRLAGRIENNTDTDLTNCTVYYGNNALALGNLPRGGTAKIDIAVPSAIPNRSSNLYDIDESRRFQVFAEDNARRSNRPMLVAWSSSPNRVFSLAGESPTVKSTTCYMIRLTVSGKRK